MPLRLRVPRTTRLSLVHADGRSHQIEVDKLPTHGYRKDVMAGGEFVGWARLLPPVGSKLYVELAIAPAWSIIRSDMPTPGVTRLMRVRATLQSQTPEGAA